MRVHSHARDDLANMNLSDRMVEAFEDPQLNSFSCTSPLNLNA